MRNWFRIEAKAGEQLATIHVYDEIGRLGFGDEGVTAARFVAALDELPASVRAIRVRVNSPGGDVFEALTIANALRAQQTEKGRTVEAMIDGLAASAATLITSAAGTVKIAANALMMVHRPHAVSFGTADDHRDMAGALDRVQQAIIDTYRWISSKSVEEITALVEATTWMTAEEAVSNGFATEIIDAVEVTAVFQPRSIKALGAVPLKFAAALTPWVRPGVADEPAPKAAPAEAILAACERSRLLSLAPALISARLPMADVEARLREAGEIRALCSMAATPQLADSYIRAGVPADVVREQLTTISALIDHIEIDGSLDPDTRRPQRSSLNVHAIYEQRNRPATTAEAN